MSVVGDWFWDRVSAVAVAIANVRANLRRPRVVEASRPIDRKKKLP